MDDLDLKNYTCIFNFSDNFTSLTVLFKGVPVLIGNELKEKLLDRILKCS